MWNDYWRTTQRPIVSTTIVHNGYPQQNAYTSALPPTLYRQSTTSFQQITPTIETLNARPSPYHKQPPQPQLLNKQQLQPHQLLQLQQHQQFGNNKNEDPFVLLLKNNKYYQSAVGPQELKTVSRQQPLLSNSNSPYGE